MLAITHLNTGYGRRQVLFDVGAAIRPGQVVAFIGPNGAGKSTVLKAILGLVKPWSGEIWLDGEIISGSSPARNAARGIALCPQGNAVFPGLTVRENLEVGGLRLPRRSLVQEIEQVMGLFPSLQNRLSEPATTLSAGQRQLVAVGRALLAKPRLLMLDEPSLGLSPHLGGVLFKKLTHIRRERGISVLIVEQKVRQVLSICDHVYALRLGRIAYDGSPDRLLGNRELLREVFL